MMHPIIMGIRAAVIALVGRSSRHLPPARAEYVHGLLAELDVISTSRATLSWCVGALLFVWRQRVTTVMRATPLYWESPGRGQRVRLYGWLVLSLVPAAAATSWAKSREHDYFSWPTIDAPNLRLLFWAALILTYVCSWTGPVIVLHLMRRLAVRRAVIASAIATGVFLAMAAAIAVWVQPGPSVPQPSLSVSLMQIITDKYFLLAAATGMIPLFLPAVLMLILLPSRPATTLLRFALIPVIGFAVVMACLFVLQFLPYRYSDHFFTSTLTHIVMTAGFLFPVMLVVAPRWPARTPVGD